ncbi:MAG TPA: recombinase family protein [Phycisphaerae bacterium]|nr:recombinase family protein [Phycisphaerae bacterium]
MRDKAIAYLRVSTPGQAGKGKDGFPRQLEAIRAYAEARRLELVEEFRDASTGTEWEGREGLAALLDRLQSNGVRLVLVERADRLARDLMVSETILAAFRKMSVQVVAADSGVDLTVADDDPTRTLIRQVLGAVAQFEKSVLVAKLAASRARVRRTTGRCEGRKPFGTRQGEAETLKMMSKLYRKPRGGERRSFGEIAKALNEAGRPTRTGKPWAAPTVKGILGRKQGH